MFEGLPHIQKYFERIAEVRNISEQIRQTLKDGEVNITTLLRQVKTDNANLRGRVLDNMLMVGEVNIRYDFDESINYLALA